MTEQEIIAERLAELRRKLADLQASIRKLEIQRALLALNHQREAEGALQ